MVRSVVLDTWVGLLKRSVIDAYMREKGWKTRDTDYYVEYRNWAERYAPAIADAPRLCVRPDERGVSGGVIYDHVDDLPSAEQKGVSVRDDRYVVRFDEIRYRIDEIISPWIDLPDSTLIGEVTVAYSNVVNSLCHGTNQNLVGDGSVGPNMTRIWDELIGHADEDGYYGPALSGAAIDAFTEYVKNLDRAVGGCGGIARAIEKYVEAQRQLWEAVPSNVSAIVSSVSGACDAIAQNGTGNSGLSLSDISIIIGSASAVPGPVGAVATGTSAVLTIASSIENKPVRQEVEIESSESAMDALDKLLNRSFYDFGVNVLIENTERQTCVQIAQNIQEVDAQRSSFDLVPGVIDTVDGVIRHDKTKVDNIVRRLDSVSLELGNIAGRLSSCVRELDPMVCTRSQFYGSSVLARDPRVGIGRNGPTDTIVTLVDLLRGILAELSGEVMAGKENFKAAMDVLDQANSENRSTLAAAAQAYGLSDQGGIDSFDFYPWTPTGQVEAFESATRTHIAQMFGLGEESSGMPDGQDPGTSAAPRPAHSVLPEEPLDHFIENLEERMNG